MILANVQKVKYKYGKLPARVAEEIPGNKLFVYSIGPIDLKIPYIIKKREINNLTIKATTLTQYNDKCTIATAKLVETMWLTRLLIPPTTASRLPLMSGQVSRIKYVTMHVSTIIYANPRIK